MLSVYYLCLVCSIMYVCVCYLPPRQRPGTGDIATPSVTFSSRTVTQKRIDVFSRNFACTCTICQGGLSLAAPKARDGRYCNAPRPSVCPSVTFSFRTVTQKRNDVFSRNFAGTCTMSGGCVV